MKRFVTINEKEYEVPEVNFDTICQLEENGVYLMSMDKNDRKIATMIRALVAWIIGEDAATASREISEHIRKGGNIIDITNTIIEAITDAGFFKQGGGNVQKMPQDHQRRQKNRDARNNTGHSQRS